MTSDLILEGRVRFQVGCDWFPTYVRVDAAGIWYYSKVIMLHWNKLGTETKITVDEPDKLKVLMLLNGHGDKLRWFDWEAM